MSHELEDNIDRRNHILGKVRRHPKGVTSDQLIRMIMEMGYNLRGSREKIKELKYGGWLKATSENRLMVKDSDSDAHAQVVEEGEGGEGSGVEE